MGEIKINFAESFRNQRALAQTALGQAADLRTTLNQLLPGEDPGTGRLTKDISKGLGSLSEIEALIREQWFRNRDMAQRRRHS